ncbi:hypothetical protein [Sporosarcina sp. FSL K6-1508]|uniref:hypothetical protein n=1 Tax=Sporosarcina sp. FSL K6-1508 TaxID=2921553 RepID=UPI0030F4FB59
MEGFKKGVDNAMPFIIVISIILMNLLLCGGIISMFFVDKEAIIAGVIAFFGAVIGGSITLMGVSKTIKENRKGERIKEIKIDLKSVEYLNDELYRLFNSLYPDKLIPEQELNNLKILRNKVSSLVNSPDVFVLGDKVNKKISDLGKLINECEMAVMLKRDMEVNPIDEIIPEVVSCFSVIEKKREELREEYMRLQAL